MGSWSAIGQGLQRSSSLLVGLVTVVTAALVSGCTGPTETATWVPAQSPPIDRSATTLTALVTRLGCNSGVTGTVLPPTIERTATQITITFTVPSSSGGNCQGNDAVPYRVELGEPIGTRTIVDGACTSGRPAATTAFCADGATRFKP